MFLEEIIYQESNISVNYNDTSYNYLQNQIKNDLINYLNDNIPDYFNEIISNYKNLNLNFISHYSYKEIQYIINDSIELSFRNYIINNFIENIKAEKLVNIKYLSIIVAGKSGVGKSTLINCLLKENQAEEGVFDITTLKTKIYISNQIPFLSLIDTRGYQLGDKFNPNEIQEEVFNIIKSHKNNTDFDEKIHCIWFCVNSSEIDESEIKLLKALYNNEDNIPLIVVFTRALNQNHVDKMQNKIMSLFYDVQFIPVLGRKTDDNESFNLDELLNMTLETIKTNKKNEIYNEIFNKYLENEKVKLANKISEIQSKAINELVNEFITNYNCVLSENDFEQFINDLVLKMISGFSLEKQISPNIKSLIENVRNNMKQNINLYIQFYSKTAQKFINKVKENKSLEYLDKQERIESANNSSINPNYKRTRYGFKDTISKFLKDNFYYITQRYFIYRFIKDFLEELSNRLGAIISSKMSNYLKSNEMNKYYENIYLKIFEEYEERINNKREYNGKIYN